MIGLLQRIVEMFVCWVKTGIVEAVNFLVAGLASAIAALLAVLPEMPETPALPAEFTSAAAWVNWVFPVSTVADFFTFMLAAWLVWQGVAIGLRWAKATGT